MTQTNYGWCPRCRAQLWTGARFCPHCGASVFGPHAGPSVLKILWAVLLGIIALPLGGLGACLLLLSPLAAFGGSGAGGAAAGGIGMIVVAGLLLFLMVRNLRG